MSFLKGFQIIENGFKEKRAQLLSPHMEGCRGIATFEEHGQSFVGCGLYGHSQGSLYSSTHAGRQLQAQDAATIDRLLHTFLEYAAALSQFEPVTFCVPPALTNIWKTACDLLPDHIRVLEVDNRITNPCYGPRYVRGVRGYSKGVDCNSNTPKFLASKFFQIDHRFCFDSKEKLDLSSLFLDFNAERCALLYDKDGVYTDDKMKKEMVAATLKKNFQIETVIWCTVWCRFLDNRIVVYCVNDIPKKTQKDEEEIFVFPEEVSKFHVDSLNFFEIPRKYMGFAFANNGIIMPSYGMPLKDSTVSKIFSKHCPKRRVVQVKIPQDLQVEVDFNQCTLSQPKDRITPSFISNTPNSLMLFDTTTFLYREFLRKKKAVDRSNSIKKKIESKRNDKNGGIANLLENLKISQNNQENEASHEIEISTFEEKNNQGNDSADVERTNQASERKGVVKKSDMGKEDTLHELPSEEKETINDVEDKDESAPIPPETLAKTPGRNADDELPVDSDEAGGDTTRKVEVILPDAPVEDHEDDNPNEEKFTFKKKPPRRLKKKKKKKASKDHKS